MSVKASCHCGNVQLQAEALPASITRCNCSTCRRYGALWAYYAPTDVQIEFGRSQSRSYIWGDRMLEFHHCQECGCLTHYTTTELCSDKIIAINTRMMEPSLVSDIPLREVDGATF